MGIEANLGVNLGAFLAGFVILVMFGLLMASLLWLLRGKVDYGHVAWFPTAAGCAVVNVIYLIVTAERATALGHWITLFVYYAGAGSPIVGARVAESLFRQASALQETEPESGEEDREPRKT